MNKLVNLKPTITFTIAEINLITEALTHRATRHEAMARARPRAAKPHDDKALAMHKLSARLTFEIWKDK